MSTGKCTFDEAWRGRCGCAGTAGGYCEKHAAKACSVCKKQATRECDHTGQFVCGAPLCDDCEGHTDTAKEAGSWGFMNHTHRAKVAAQPPAPPAEEDGGNGWTGWACQYPGKLPRLYGAREIAELNFHPEEGDRLFQVREVVPGAAAAAPSQDAEDAARHRWLRDRVGVEWKNGRASPWVAVGMPQGATEFRGQTDQAIDAARAAQAHGGKA